MNYTDYVKPAIGTILQKLKLDKKYCQAKEGYLYYINEQGKTVEVRDFVGGYGSLVLGHNNKSLVDYAKQLLDENIPVHDQLNMDTLRKLAGRVENILLSVPGAIYVKNE